MNTNKNKIAVVTGSSSGIGFETSLALARNGFYTYATMRNLDKSKTILELTSLSKILPVIFNYSWSFVQRNY